MKTPLRRRPRPHWLALALLAAMLVTQSLPTLAAEPQLLVTYDDGTTLRKVDPLTLNTSAIGAFTTGTPISAIARSSNGLLYAIGGITTPALYTIDPADGATVLVGPLGITRGFDSYFDGLTFDAAGVLLLSFTDFGDMVSTSPLAQFYRVNVGTGHATAIGSSFDPNAFFVTGLAGACDGTVYARVNRPTGSRLATVNLSTGALTPLGGSGSGSDVLDLDITVAHGTGTLWAVSPLGSAYKVDKTNGALTFLGDTLDQTTHFPGSVAADAISACRFKRSVTLSYSTAAHRFQGAITTQSAHCRKGAEVVVHRVKASGDVVVGSHKTDATGHFAVPAARFPGKYYVTAARTSGGLGICLAAKSPTITLTAG